MENMENLENIEKEEAKSPEEVLIVEEIAMGEIPSLEETGKRIKFVVSYKTMIIGLIVLAVLALVYFGRGLIVAATVNGTPVTRFAVIKQLEMASGKDALDSIIKEKLITMEAAKKGIHISDDDINAEIKKVEESLKTQGTTLDDALTQQGMSREDLRKRIVIQLSITKLVEDKTSVSDKEVEEYITTNKYPLTKGKEADEKASIKEQIKNQKLSDEAAKLVDQLMTAAKINYWVKY